MSRRLWLLVVACYAASAWSCPDPYLLHPEVAPAGVVSWPQDAEKGPLRIHLEWACPAGPGPFPSILVHPYGGGTADEMRGVGWDLAGRGYLAVAADYRREIGGELRRNLLPWRSPADVTASLEVILGDRRVDRQRLAAIGFSQGGVFSLLIAAHSPDIRTVVAYYPVTDFASWLDQRRENPGRRLAFRLIRRYFRKQAGAKDDAELDRTLAAASPLQKADRIRVPTLLVHGDRDRSAPLSESERLRDRLSELGTEVELLVIEDAGHVFNFRRIEPAEEAWQATVEWLDRHLRSPPVETSSAGS